MKTMQTCGTNCGCEGSGQCKFPDSPAWQQYNAEAKKHYEKYALLKPMRAEFQSQAEYETALSKWSQDEAMSAPNKPGYWRANND